MLRYPYGVSYMDQQRKLQGRMCWRDKCSNVVPLDDDLGLCKDCIVEMQGWGREPIQEVEVQSSTDA